MRDYQTTELKLGNAHPVYQLNATMANGKMPLEDGLKIAGLTAMHWLRQRIRKDIPIELQSPEPDAYADIALTDLTSVSYNRGCILEIESLPEQRIWCLRLTESDMQGSKRIIETNISFSVSRGELLCGFKTVAFEFNNTGIAHEAYLSAVAKQLAENPVFGLKQVTALSPGPIRVTQAEELKRLLHLHKDEKNHLPLIIFTQLREDAPLPSFRTITLDYSSLSLPGVSPKAMIQYTMVCDPDYEIDAFAAEGFGFYRTYILSDDLLERFSNRTGITLAAGDVLFWEPTCFGGRAMVDAYKRTPARREEVLERLKRLGINYTQDKHIPFESIVFVANSRQILIDSVQPIDSKCENCDKNSNSKLQELEKRCDDLLTECHQLTARLERQKLYQKQLEHEKAELLEKCRVCQTTRKHDDHAAQEKIAYLSRRVDRPMSHSGISQWVSKHFSDHLILHPKAVGLLEDNSAREIDLHLICDALDFLATDYWDSRFNRKPWENVLTLCAQKYGRPFKVAQVGNYTTAYTPSQYRIKYYTNDKCKRYESILDYHLRVGNDPQNLLRIYFLIDETERLIVVGSLPKHLKAISIQ